MWKEQICGIGPTGISPPSLALMEELPEQTQLNRLRQASPPRGFLFKFADGLGPDLGVFNPHLGQVLDLVARAGWEFVGCTDTRDYLCAHPCKGEGPALRFSGVRRHKKPSSTPETALFNLENTQTIPGSLGKFTAPHGRQRCAVLITGHTEAGARRGCSP